MYEIVIHDEVVDTADSLESAQIKAARYQSMGEHAWYRIKGEK